IGEIPSHWDVNKLFRLFKINTGFTPSTTNSKFYDNGIYDWINISDLESKYVSTSKTKLTDIAVQGKEIVPKGSLLYSFKLSVGKMAFADKDLYTNEAIFSIYPDDNINLNYYYYLLDRILIHNSNENIYGAKILNQELIKASKLIVPSKIEQTTIANYLDQKTTQIDDLIAKKERLIQLLEEERIAIINQAVTKGLPAEERLKAGLDPNVPMKDSGIEWLGEIPAHWEVTKIKTVTIKIGSGVTPKGGAEIYESSGIPLLRSQNIYFDGFRLENVAYITREIHDSMKNSQVQSGDVLLNITGGSIGRCYFVTNEFKEANVNQHVCIVRPNERIITEFLYYVLSSTIGQHQIDLCQTGGNREALNFEHLKNFFLCLPKVDEQKNIVQRLKSSLNNFNLTIEKFRKEIELLKEYKTALISEVVTGKVDVRNEILN
ncbi:MAG: restriction endonuclease subunit S, partial [Flavobacteriales bacterium]|nr:restriction endonuclease subunit S [Flavobacteriales bacterium]